jgi:predicted permease
MKRLFRLSDSRPDPGRDVDDEIRFHLEMRTREFVEQGLSAEDARRAAAESFGDVAAIEAECRGERARRTRERSRRDRTRRLALDLSFALRTLRTHKGFALAAVLTLALGIGATTAVFSVVDGVLLRPLPYPESDQLVIVGFTAPGLGYDDMPFSDAVYVYAQTVQRSFQGMALYANADANLSGEGEPVRVVGELVTPGFFELLGVKPALGRAFTPADGRPGAEPVVILSHVLWVSRYGGDAGILGQTVMMDGAAHRVVGVMPSGFAFRGETDDVWLPLIVDPAHLQAGNFSYPCLGRLKPGETPATARADLQRLVAHIGDVVPGLSPALVERARFAPAVRSLKERVVGDIRRPLWIILGTGAFVLLIACANVANLFLVRAEGRGRELALRTALGASRSDLIGLMLGESLLLATIGGALGLGLALFGVKGLLSLAPSTIPRAGAIGLNGDVLLFTLVVSVLAGLLFGSAPLLRRRSTDPSAALRESGRLATAGRERGRARSALVAVQVALALVLLVGAGLMIRTFQAMRSVDPGFEPDGVVTFEVALPRGEDAMGAKAAVFWRELVERVGALPGVRSAAIINNLPLGASILNGGIDIEGHPVPDGGLSPTAERKNVTPAYFATLGIPVLQGRPLDAHDRADAFHGVVVNRAFARHWWPGGNALGARIRESSDDPWYEIVGVVGDVRFRSLEEPGTEAVYFPVPTGSARAPYVPRHMAVVIRTDGNPTPLMAAVRAQLRALDASLPIANVRTMRSLVNRSMARTSFVLVLLGIAAAVALLLGIVGIYGVIAYVVSQRRREIGVRMALGATAREVRGMVVRQGVMLAVVGVVVGLGAAFALSRLLGTLLYGVSASDPATYIVVAAVLLGVAALASYLPARRASAIDPMESLRAE